MFDINYNQSSFFISIEKRIVSSKFLMIPFGINIKAIYLINYLTPMMKVYTFNIINKEFKMLKKYMSIFIFLLIFTNIYLQSLESPKKILIAYEDTKYKKALKDLLISKLENFDIKVIDHKSDGIKDENPKDYSAVIISNSGVNSKVRPWITEWLNLHKDNNSNILLHTTQKFDWEVKVEVDSITSASKKDNLEDLTKDIIVRINKLLK